MEHLSRLYGWTPEQIRNQRAEDLDAYMTIIAERAAIEKREAIRKK